MNTQMPDLRRHEAAVAFMDVVDSVGLIEGDELQAVKRLRALLDRVAAELVAGSGGRVAETRGDGLVLTFPSCDRAIACAVKMHAAAAAEASANPGFKPMKLRVGLHWTELLDDGQALYGGGVNLAARVAALARAGETVLSSDARDRLAPPWAHQVEDLGECWLKHVAQPMRLFRILAAPPAMPADLESAVAARMALLPTLCVLTRVADDGGPTDWGIADIACDVLTRHLSQSRFLHVISPMTNRSLRRCDLALGEVLGMLRADYAVVIHSSGSPGLPTDTLTRVPIELALWRRGAPAPLWTHADHVRPVDVTSPQGDSLGLVVEQIGQRILRTEQQIASGVRELPNLSSHSLYLSAVDMLHRFSATRFDRARELLLELHHRAAAHAEPLAWLARWHVFRVVQGWSDDREKDSAQALHFSSRALDLDPRSALALTMAGSVHVGVRQDAKAAQAFYDKALDANPNDSLAWLMSSVAQGFMNAPMHALKASEAALGLAPLDPTRPYYDALSATAALCAGELERCIALAGRAILANGSHGSAYRSMAIAQALQGRMTEATDTVRRLLAVEPHCTVKTYLGRVPNQDPNRNRFAQLLQEAGLPAD